MAPDCLRRVDDEPGDKTITVYSGRAESLVKPVLEKFQQASGITVEVRYGDTAQMAAQLLEEGDKSPADVFLAQDAGALGAVAKEGLFATLPDDVLGKVPAAYRARSGSGSASPAASRVLVYNADQVPAADLPKSVFELTDPQWRGKVGVAPTNGSFQAFVTALRVQHGDAKAKRVPHRPEGQRRADPREQRADRAARSTTASSPPAWSTTTTSSARPRSAAPPSTSSRPSCTSSRTATPARWSTSPASACCSKAGDRPGRARPRRLPARRRRRRPTSPSRPTSTRWSLASPTAPGLPALTSLETPGDRPQRPGHAAGDGRR